ncbi:PP2C family protein-serine/threonine phosphatase [Haloactinomyces albus]|uniref:Sigma-B regulation protein RsbU (Phosphoserine phosphatase) n=1 Tax=Haloactinomyces albus TaxID=1352928 RepID=A0AAE3ZBD1_9ACTN|nr:SpoIIE family protein phosphatase [Haloactinomyces albus]MDR7300608.1 sigma-B regulation protein RsbU (phosphoserine phosphatase) [Haloactinomyces albus]
MAAEQTIPGITPAPHRRNGDAEAIEAARLAAVARYDIVDTPRDEAFDRIAALAARWLDTPIATVSIVDSDWIWFKATHGMSEITRTAREPGLCDSAISQDAPYVVPDTLADPRAAGNALVRGELGIRFYAAAPIRNSEGHRLGTVDVLDTRPREVGDTELTTLQDLAAVVMDELELRLSALTTLRHERRLRERMEGFASTLQRTLLPPSLPRVPGLELACHYHAASASDVTGDFYDVFSLGDGRWAFFLGDVSGHGAPAATVTSLTRYTLRAAALHSPDPAAALMELNAALLRDPHVPQCCTVLFGILQPVSTGGFDIVLAGGGHPPALWMRPEHGVVEEIHPDGGMLVGALPDASFATSRLHLAEGQTLLLYTDGLVEARPGGEFFGEERLRTFLADNISAGAETLIGELTTLIGRFDPAPDDDIALLALRVPTASPDAH